MRLVKFEQPVTAAGHAQSPVYINPEQVTSVGSGGATGVSMIVANGVYYVVGTPNEVSEKLVGDQPFRFPASPPAPTMLFNAGFPPAPNPAGVPEGVALAAMCIFELSMDPGSEEQRESVWFKAMNDYRDENGVCQLRDHILNDLAPAAQGCWEYFRAHDGYDGSFDWEFLPIWLEACVDWDEGLWIIHTDGISRMNRALGN